MTDLSVFSENARRVYGQLLDRARNARKIWNHPDSAWTTVGPSNKDALEALRDADLVEIGDSFENGWILARIRDDKLL